MGDRTKCFVCQSKLSKSQSADDGSSSAKRRKKDNNSYHSLDSSTWTTFCHYFYPPPLVGLLESPSSSNSPAPENASHDDNEDFSLPVFCGACYQTILSLCNLHHQLELIQSQISKTVAQVSLTFVQEDHENHGNEEYDDDRIYSMRRCIRQRYQPFVSISRSSLDNVNENVGADFSIFIKEEVEDSSILGTSDIDIDEELCDAQSPVNLNINDSQLINQAEDSPAENNIIKKSGVQVEKKKYKRGKRKTRYCVELHSSESEDNNHNHSHGDNDEEFQSDSDYEPEPVKSRKKSVPKYQPKKKVESQASLIPGIQVKDDDKDEDKEKPKRKRNRKPKQKKNEEDANGLKTKREPIPEDPQVGENIYEYAGKWRYEKRWHESKKFRIFYCLSCVFSHTKRSGLVNHIKIRHNNEPSPRRTRLHRIDENNIIFNRSYPITRVTEPNGIFFKCGTCENLHKTLRNATHHIRTVHINTQKWICEQCGHISKTKVAFNAHVARHTNTKHICEECGKQFKCRTSLYTHRDIHSTEKIMCECGSVFSYKSTLKIHRKVFNHPDPKAPATPENPWVHQVCPTCKQEFVSPEKMQRHAAACWNKRNQPKEPCDWCGAVVLPISLKSHKVNWCKERFKFNKVKEAAGDLEVDLDRDFEACKEDEDEEAT